MATPIPASSDEALLGRLLAELNKVFPRELRHDSAIFLAQLRDAPRGLRAMAATFNLDVSMSLDDLAWHFVNHPNPQLHEETAHALRELEATEVAEIFDQATDIIEPHQSELERISEAEDSNSAHAWLVATGIQASIDPLSKKLTKLLGQWPKEGLFHYWVVYARKYPGRFPFL